MSFKLARLYADLDRPVRTRARIVLVVLVLALGASFSQPLWRISMTAPQYPNGLYVDVYSYKVEGGHQGHDIAEINELNHYIGMMKIDRANLSDLDWLPFALGIMIVWGLRVAAIGNVRSLVDLGAITGYLMVFGFARYVYRLYVLGHNLDPHAPINIKPFMPVVIGTKQVANFTISSYPQIGGVLMFLFAMGIASLTLWHLWSDLAQRRG